MCENGIKCFTKMSVFAGHQNFEFQGTKILIGSIIQHWSIGRDCSHTGCTSQIIQVEYTVPKNER